MCLACATISPKSSLGSIRVPVAGVCTHVDCALACSLILARVLVGGALEGLGHVTHVGLVLVGPCGRFRGVNPR